MGKRSMRLPAGAWLVNVVEEPGFGTRDLGFGMKKRSLDVPRAAMHPESRIPALHKIPTNPAPNAVTIRV
jgi:hypothetical protein